MDSEAFGNGSETMIKNRRSTSTNRRMATLSCFGQGGRVSVEIHKAVTGRNTEFM